MKEWEKAWGEWKYGRIASDASDFKAGWDAAVDFIKTSTEPPVFDPDNPQS